MHPCVHWCVLYTIEYVGWATLPREAAKLFGGEIYLFWFQWRVIVSQGLNPVSEAIYLGKTHFRGKYWRRYMHTYKHTYAHTHMHAHTHFRHQSVSEAVITLPLKPV